MFNFIIVCIVIVFLYKYFNNKIKKEKITFNFKVYNFKIKNYTISLYFVILIISIIIFCLCYFLIYEYLKNIIATIIFSLIFSFIPFQIYKYVKYYKKEKIIKMLPNFFINVKNYVKIDNNIITAFEKIYVEEPLNDYINKFNISVKKGINIYDCFENLKKEINIKRISDFLSIIQFCYTNGGNFEKLMNKFIKQEIEININKEKEKQKSFSSKIMLIVLIIINILVIFCVMMSKIEYYKIYTETLIGKIIMIINSITYIFIIYMYLKINKLEE